MKKTKQNILLINPWIADFAAYDLWAKPLGLLYIGAFLRHYGYDLALLDFLDRNKWHKGTDKTSNTGRGKYHRQVIDKPKVLAHVPRHFALYGATEAQIKNALSSMTPPSAILITSHMTYWYVGVQKTIKILRRYFPDVPIILGGSYVTLCENHAHNHMDADYFITGHGEKKALQILDSLHGINRNYAKIPDYDDSNFPPYELYDNLDTLPLMTSRGCPNRCSYCATKKLHPRFSRRSVDNLLAEIRYNIERYGITRYAFYDDALFANKEQYSIPFLKAIIAMDKTFEFYSPNGLFARAIDKELAELMKQSGFKMVRLSLESSISRWQAASSNKVSQQDFRQAVKHLLKAGYSGAVIEAYLIMGLPGQSYRDVKESIEFVYNTGAISRLASFTPIPGTEDWQRAVSMKLLDPDIDPLLTNNSLYPCASPDLTVAQFRELKDYANQLNNKLREQER